MENVRRFHGPEQSMPEGQFSIAPNRPTRGFYSQAQVTDVHGCFFKVQPDKMDEEDQEKTAFITS